MVSSLIPAWAFKDARKHITEPLCFSFNQFLTEQLFLTTLSVPVFKKDDSENPIKYQPISLTGALANIFETLLRDQIIANLEKSKLLATTKFGYRKKVSITDALLYCTKKIRFDLNEKKKLQDFF